MSQFEIKAPRNSNYSATVVTLKSFVDLPNANNIKGALIFGNHVIVSKDANEGDIGLFFPVETQLSEGFLSNNNLYRKAEHGNVDPDKKGFFDQHGRVKAVKFLGHKSEGFFIPLNSLQYVVGEGNDTNWFRLDLGKSFDFIGDHEICRKYVPKRNRTAGSGGSKYWTQHKQKMASLEEQIVHGQFRLHADTDNLRRNIHKIQPTDYISVSDKWHGTSVVISKVLTLRKLPWYERLLQKLGVKIQTQEFGLVYSSRKVIKAVNGVEKHSNHYYTSDIWGVVAKEVEDKIPVGFTVYGEIVGFTPDGAPIQKGYHYGCPVGGHKLVIYRVTSTSAAGNVIELTWHQMQEFAAKYGFQVVPTLWYGYADKLFNLYEDSGTWHDSLLAKLQEMFVHDQMCPYNSMEVPAEGVVVRIDHLESTDAFKLKNFKFLERETKALDKGEVDIETEESDVSEQVNAV